MRRYDEPATVHTDEDDQPVRFTAWGRDYAIAEILGPHWEELLPWWTGEHAGKPLEERTVRHYRVRANGRQKSAVVELVQRGQEWRVVAVED
jgi:hypothetical protein